MVLANVLARFLMSVDVPARIFADQEATEIWSDDDDDNDNKY